MNTRRILLTLCCSLFLVSTAFAQNRDAERGIEHWNKKQYTQALPLLQRAAKAGNIAVLPYLGKTYLYGLGTSKNYTAALNMFNRGAANGNTESLCGLYAMYIAGQGVTQDQAKAFGYLKTAADKQHPWACSALSVLYRNGEGCEKDLAKAIEYAERGVRLGDYTCCSWLGSEYYTGEHVAQDYAKALSYWTRPGVEYEAPVRLATAMMLYEGRGTSQQIQSYPCDYKQKFYGNGVTGKTYLAEALTIVNHLVDDGYEEARSLQRQWKFEYDEKVTAANKVTAPRFSKAATKYINTYDVPREMAYCGGRAQYEAVIRSNGKVGNLRTLVCSVAAKASFDQTFLAGLPAFIPGTKGGEPTDMHVVFWVEWVPSRKVQIARFQPL